MLKIWSDEAWSDYLYWQSQDKKTLKKINDLIKDIERSGFSGLGKAEPLRYHHGWSRRIDKDLDKKLQSTTTQDHQFAILSSHIQIIAR